MYRLEIFILMLFSLLCSAQQSDSLKAVTQRYQISEGVVYEYQKPRFKDIFTNIPRDLRDLGVFCIQRENLKWDALALGSTLALLPIDQQLVDESSELGNRLDDWDEPSRYTRLFGIEVLPTSSSSAVYFIGTGNTTLILSGFFYAYGKIGKDDYRALNTASELVEVLLSVGITTQTIKRISGRESPIAATTSGGAWNPFPSFKAFATETPSYDAMPSGHMATYMATVTVIARNYPEYKWIKPVCYPLGAVLGFNMMSGKVHWASDYPIAILAGYVIGKQAADRRIIKSSGSTGMTENKLRYHTNFSYQRWNKYRLMGVTISF